MLMYGNVERITFVENIAEGVDLCKVAIDFDEPYIFYDWNKLHEFVGKYVEYSTRMDFYKNEKIVVICNIAEVYKVNTVDKVEGIKLIPENDKVRIGCTIDISSVKFGDTVCGCVAFLSDYKKGSSEKAQWIDCKVIDMHSKVFTLRIFVRGEMVEGVSAENAVEAKVGKYVKFDLSSTNYGFQTSCIELENIPVTHPPEVDVAVAIINEAVVGDSELIDYMITYDYINQLKGLINGELGYDLVFVAAEIQEIQALQNISNYYDTKLMIRAAVTSRGYLLPTITKFSRSVLNINKLLRTKLGKERDLLLLLDPLAEEDVSPTKRMYMRIASLVNEIINDRRQFTVNYVDKFDLKELSRMSGGLLC